MATRINVTRASLPPFEEYIQEIAPLWNSHWLTNMGEKHHQLEARLAQYLQVPQVSLFSNGHLCKHHPRHRAQRADPCFRRRGPE